MGDLRDILPEPFDWVYIPAGKVTLIDEPYEVKYEENSEKITFDVPAFHIAKYPLTNEQYAKFVEAGGYDERKWWTDAGWEAKLKGVVIVHGEDEDIAIPTPWAEPRYWRRGISTSNKWTCTKCPVIGVSWYEAMAFCWWLSETIGEKITLPTEQQWQRAAQTLPDGSDSGYAYPWGNEWDASKCNNGIEKGWQNNPSPVTQYEGKGDSPCGVVDMSGNVFEWCLTGFESGEQDIHKLTTSRVVGGWWVGIVPSHFRVDYRLRLSTEHRNETLGFRLVRSVE
jgi:formylglycine-generating enzyme required for sulfatase activity